MDAVAAGDNRGCAITRIEVHVDVEVSRRLLSLDLDDPCIVLVNHYERLGCRVEVRDRLGKNPKRILNVTPSRFSAW